MDPLTALSLACNVIQVIDFSAKIVTNCKELYENGASAKNKEIEFMAKYLASVSTDLKLPETSPSAESAQQVCQEDEKLQKLAQRCSETANELICELQKLAIQGTHRKRDAILTAVKGTWNKTVIEGIENRLEQHRKTLDTLILIDLRYVRFPSTVLVCTKGKQWINAGNMPERFPPSRAKRSKTSTTKCKLSSMLSPEIRSHSLH